MEKAFMQAVEKTTNKIIASIEVLGLSVEEGLKEGKKNSCLGNKYWAMVVENTEKHFA